VDIADNNEKHLEHEDMITRWCSKGNVDMDTLVLLHVDDRSTFSLSDFPRLLHIAKHVSHMLWCCGSL